MSNYIGKGILTIGGEAEYCFAELVYLKFSVNDLVFIKAKALKGELSRICIKKIRVKSYQMPVSYEDTTNRIWFEKELVSHEEAINLSIAFYESQINKIG